MTYSPNFRGTTNKVGADKLSSTFVNGSGGTLVKATPVSVNTIGTLVSIDVSDDNSVARLVGLVTDDLVASATGGVADGGRIEDVAGLGFSLGDSLYVSKAGFLTTTKPDIGVDGFVDGDWVIFVGVIVKNQFDNTKKDLKLSLERVGKL